MAGVRCVASTTLRGLRSGCRFNSTVPQGDVEECQRVAGMSYGGTIGITYTGKRGMDVVNDPLLNRGTAFTAEERSRLMLTGLVPSRYSTMEQQLERLDDAFGQIDDPLQKYEFCTAVQDRNEILFYRWLMHNIEALAPIIYTPTVGLACQKFARVYKRQRGMYFNRTHRNHFLSALHNWPSNEVDVAVITDGGRILGLGDLGADGMAIPIGKLSLYVGVGGIHPGRTLPIMLDVGTNNPDVMNNPHYMGMRHERMSGTEYYLMVDELMRAVKRRWPNCLVQFEDFSSHEAPVVMEVYRNKTCCFNDDIQGTGAVVLAGLINALRLVGHSASDLPKQRIVIAGSGSAGLGVSNAILQGLMKEGASAEEAAAAICMVDVEGVVGEWCEDRLHPMLHAFMKPEGYHGVQRGDDLLTVVNKVRPTILLGLTGFPGVFTQEVVEAMSAINERPIVFPLSNPTSRAECTAEDAYRWSGGRCIFASGSPFAPVEYNGQTLYPSQSNNMHIFPGVGLGVVLSRATRVTDEMFYVSSKALAYSVSDADLTRTGKLYPDISGTRHTSSHIASAVMLEAFQSGVAAPPKRSVDAYTPEWVAEHMFKPVYGPIVSRWENDDLLTSLAAR